MLAVEHSPRHTIPELIQRLEYDGEVSSSVASEKAVNVFEDNNLWATSTNQCCEIVEEARLGTSKPVSRTHSRKREILARKAGGPDFRFGDFGWLNIRNILKEWNIRPMS